MRLFLACAASAAIVLAAPFMGRLQSLLRESISTRAYVVLLGAVVACAVITAIVVAFTRIKAYRGRRIAAMAAAIALAVAYTSVLSTGIPEIDAVERVHFVEYGLIAVLFYRVWRRAGDGSTILLPILCGFIVGTLDEWLQWFIPYRVGEMHDVLLNFTALVCGVLFGFALEPPPSFSWRPSAGGWSRIGAATAAAVLVFGAFVGIVHLGHVLHVEGIGRFSSRHTAADLDTLQHDRAARWLTSPPLNIPRLSREDQYLDEGLWHVRERNRRWDAQEITAAWHENLILERFFAPVLDRSTYVSANGNRWPPEHRADAHARAIPDPAFVSQAEAYPILAWSKLLYWSLVVVLALLCAGLPMLKRRLSRRL
jgi:VanZ family protein